MARARAAPRSPQFAWLITGTLLVMAVSLTVTTALVIPNSVGEWPLALVYLVLFWAAEITVLRFEVRRQVLAVSLTELPLLLSLFYLPPLTVVATRLLAAAAAQVWQRVSPVKACFNLSVFAAGTALAALVVRSWRPIWSPTRRVPGWCCSRA